MDLNKIIYYFILVCLISVYINQSSSQLTEEELEAIKKIDKLFRIDKRAVDDIMATGGVTKSLGLTSTTTDSYREVTEDKKTTFIFFKNPLLLPTIAAYSKHSSEEEVILPAGIHVRYSDKKDDTLTAEIIYPAEEKDRYWSDHALRYCYQQYLNRSYKECADEEYLGELEVKRPNHGLVHTYRVMLYIKPIIDYFAAFAKDEEFRRFCFYVTEADLIALELAAAFSVTGRESEVSFTKDLESCLRYRAASADYFEKYCKQFPGFIEFIKTAEESNEECIKRMKNIIEYMGNPNYQAKFNNAVAETDKKKRNYLHTILTMAHKLDLPRCYGVGSFKKAFYDFNDSLVIINDVQRAAFFGLVKYAIALIEIHGDSLRCTLDEMNELVLHSQSYEEPFSLLSSSPSLVEEVSACIPIPTIDLVAMSVDEKEIVIEHRFPILRS